MRDHPSLFVLLLFFSDLLMTLPSSTKAQQCGGDSPCASIWASWQVKDSITACPAGDTVITNRPERLRVTLTVIDCQNCYPVVGLAPELIYVTYSIISGNLKVNDQATRVNMDDSTDVNGVAHITIPSFSGCGKVRLRLWGASTSPLTRDVIVRATDTNADGRTTGSDSTSACDLNFNGIAGDSTDRRLVRQHIDHWRRNVLHGTLVRRTNLSYVDEGSGAIGESQVFWSGSQNWLSYTAHGADATHCHIQIVGSSPPNDTPRLFAYVADTSDYDPSWSPLNTEIAFGRADYRIIRKGIAGFTSDTQDKLVAASGDFDEHGDLTCAISPNGQWVAFARKDQSTLDYHIWKVPITGGQPTQLTFIAGVGDQYPNWSPDGQWITFDREIGFPNEHNSYKVKANQTQSSDTTAIAIYSAPSGTDAATPSYSADGLILTCGVGTHSSSIRNVRAYTLDPGLASPKPILNYPDTAFAIHGLHPVLSPKLSPDGTRSALVSKQIWAARRVKPILSWISPRLHRVITRPSASSVPAA